MTPVGLYYQLLTYLYLLFGYLCDTTTLCNLLHFNSIMFFFSLFDFNQASDLEAEIDELKHQLTVAKALVDQTQKRFIDVYTANTNTNTSSISLIGKSFSSQTSSFVL